MAVDTMVCALHEDETPRRHAAERRVRASGWQAEESRHIPRVGGIPQPCQACGVGCQRGRTLVRGGEGLPESGVACPSEARDSIDETLGRTGRLRWGAIFACAAAKAVAFSPWRREDPVVTRGGQRPPVGSPHRVRESRHVCFCF